MDHLDQRILQELQRDGRQSFRQLAGLLGSTTPTVGARVRRLTEMGLLRGVRADVPSEAVATPQWVLLARAKPSLAPEVAARVAEFAGAERVLLLGGGRILAHLRAASVGKLESELAAMEGLAGHDLWPVADVLAEREPDLAEVELVPRCAQCRGPIHGEGHAGRFGGRRSWFCCPQCRKAFAARHEELSGQKAKGG